MAQREAAVARVAARKYWREAEARVVVDAWRRSGETLARFALSQGIGRKRLERWARRLRAAEAETVRFYPVRLVEQDGRRARRGERIELVRGDDWRIRVPQGFAAADLQQILDVLEGRH